MLVNYLLTTLRSFKRNVSYVFLNVLGLALGIGTSLVIYIVVSYELSYDRHHSNYDKIYRVTTVAELPEKTEYGAGLPHPFGDAVRADFPFVSEVVKMDYQWGGAFASFMQDQPLHKFHETEGLVFASPEIFEVFSFRPIAGDLSKGISEPYGAAISDKWAEKYFDLPHERLQEAIGQVIAVNSQLNVVINGVFEAPPKTTDFPFQLIVHYGNLGDLDDDFQEGKSWNNTNSTTNCYVVLNDGATPRQFTESADSLMAKIYGKEEAERSDRLLQPLSDVHFNADFGNYGRVREKRWLYTVSIVGIFLLVAAAINFVNLATAQAGKRAREIGIRKVMGGHRRQLFTQFYIETLLVTILAAFISLAIAEVLLILLSDVLGVRLYIEFSQRPDLLAFLLAVVASVSAMAGIYPSMFLSGINVVQAIKSKSALHGAGRGASLRRLLVVFQFVISQVLIICTVVILLQLRYVQTKPLGFRKEAILIVGVPGPPASSFETLRERLLTVNGVEDVAFSMAEPLSGANSFSNFSYPAGGSNENYMGNFKFIDAHFVELFDLELLAGRNLRPQDSLHAAIINEKVAQMLGFGSAPDAVGAKIKTGVGGETEIVGVVKDFHLYTFHSGIGPTLLMYNPEAFYSAAIRFSSADVSLSSAKTTIGQIEGIWSENFPEAMFQHAFLEDEIQRKYSSEKNLSTLLLIFSGIAIFIGALGLYGLVSFMAHQRVKEIGVRKVLGASVFEIVLVFNKEVVILIFSAFVISAPLAWWAMSRWLQDFAYQISLNGFILMTGVLLSVLIAIASTVYRTLAAARANPVDSLRSE